MKEWNDEIIFLHTVRPGGTDRSYGIQVARLAGLPPAVVARARRSSASSRASASISPRPSRPPAAQPAQLTLFPPAHDPILKDLAALDIGELTPLQALNLLAEWQSAPGAPVVSRIRRLPEHVVNQIAAGRGRGASGLAGEGAGRERPRRRSAHIAVELRDGGPTARPGHRRRARHDRGRGGAALAATPRPRSVRTRISTPSPASASGARPCPRSARSPASPSAPPAGAATGRSCAARGAWPASGACRRRPGPRSRCATSSSTRRPGSSSSAAAAPSWRPRSAP